MFKFYMLLTIVYFYEAVLNFLELFNIRKRIFNNRMSYMAYYTKDKEYVKIFDYESMNIFFILYEYMIKKVDFQNLCIKRYLQAQCNNNDIKYYIVQFYIDQKRFSVIHSERSKVHVDHEKYVNLVAYVFAGNENITDEFHMLMPSIMEEQLTVKELLLIIQKMFSKKNIFENENQIMFMDMGIFSERILKENDIIKI